jgi:hypothetical protein
MHRQGSVLTFLQLPCLHNFAGTFLQQTFAMQEPGSGLSPCHEAASKTHIERT